MYILDIQRLQKIIQIKMTILIELTADNPLINKNIIESVLNNHIENKNFYTSNILHRTWPKRGLDVEVVKMSIF